jgi:hypothetical protein
MKLREGNMENLVPDHLTFSEVGHLPIIKDFAKKIKLVETLDTMVDSEMELSPGVAIWPWCWTRFREEPLCTGWKNFSRKRTPN